MVRPSLEEMKAMKGYGVIPMCTEIYADVITPISLLRKLNAKSKCCYLLESVEGGSKWGRYSFLGYEPKLHLFCKDKSVTIENGAKETRQGADPMEVAREILKEYRGPQFDYMPPFTGGFVGYFSYEMIQYAEPKLHLKSGDGYDCELMLFDHVIAYDHLKQKIVVVVNVKTDHLEENYQKGLREIERFIDLIHQADAPEKTAPSREPVFTCNTSKEEYCAMVEKAKEHIRQGDIFQAVLSRRFEADYEGDLLNAYRVLRTTNPSPYMFYLHSEDISIAGASPETLIKKTGDILETFPVAGTRPRGGSNEEDERLRQELLQDEKEKAEHNMLVDLARNDIGKLSRFGTVEVSDYMAVHKFSHVMHIASVVNGAIREDKDACDAITAALPAGTLSGAPKIRACQIIEALEKEPRGIYGGAIGYLDFSGNMDVCIAIRMAVQRKNKVYVQSGAGIVADSVPETEYEECAHKAQAVIQAVTRAGEVNR